MSNLRTPMDRRLHGLGRRSAAIMLGACLLHSEAAAARPPCETAPCPTAWAGVGEPERQKVFALAEDYKAFMGGARTQGMTVRETLRRARAVGFQPWTPQADLRPGSRWYSVNRGRALVLLVVGKAPAAEGFRIAAAHIDSNYLELKARPLFAAEGFALLRTTTHGKILNYEWLNTPLALVGHAVRKDGSGVDIAVGLAPQDPVLMIAGLSPQVNVDLRERRSPEIVLAEELTPLAGALPATEGGGVLAAVRDVLRQTYGLSSDDLVTADLALVPAMPPRDVGFDRTLMEMYGQDDRFGAFAALRALLDLQTPEHTAVLYLADNEETGDNNTGGAASQYLPQLLRDLAADRSAARTPAIRPERALAASKVMSIDVNDAVNPTWPSAWESGNAPRVGLGVNLKIYGGGNNATPEYGAWIRKLLDDAGVAWQTATYKAGQNGGGTLGRYLALQDMDVIDVGAPVLSIHNTYEISSKIDLWSLYTATKAFYVAR